MAEIYPFRALHYNSAAVDLQKVVTQPYDKISPEMRARYYAASPSNFVRLILRQPTPGSSQSVYSEAAAELQNWIQERTLVSEGEPAIYPYVQEFTVPGEPSNHKQRRGFVALLRIEEYSAGVVYRHEETLSGPKADRMELLKATRCNFGHIFMLYSDPRREIEKLLGKETQAKPWQQVTDEYSSVHSMWRVSDPRVLEHVIDAMQSRKLVIADGHHRYETSLAYARDHRRNAPEDDRANYVMATFVPLESDGLLILPTHRVVHSLPGFNWEQLCSQAAPFFEVKKLACSGAAAQDVQTIRQALEQSGRGRPTIAAYAGPQRAALFSLKKDADLAGALGEFPETLRRLDVVLLHGLVLEKAMRIDRQAVREQKHLRYVREFEQAVEEVNRGQAQVAFLMNPTPIQAVCEKAYAGLPLPQKSTDFYPKLLSGLTVYWMDNPAGL
ncbi:MAG: DUF1015 domain-containing protein [Acidobacteria bacterium]|nr:MAG: DUF1015 domain-containing protein [Acidobacteriota bacterium]